VKKAILSLTQGTRMSVVFERIEQHTSHTKPHRSLAMKEGVSLRQYVRMACVCAAIMAEFAAVLWPVPAKREGVTWRIGMNLAFVLDFITDEDLFLSVY
jgi:hypothetical protein